MLDMKQLVSAKPHSLSLLIAWLQSGCTHFQVQQRLLCRACPTNLSQSLTTYMHKQDSLTLYDSTCEQQTCEHCDIWYLAELTEPHRMAEFHSVENMPSFFPVTYVFWSRPTAC